MLVDIAPDDYIAVEDRHEETELNTPAGNDGEQTIGGIKPRGGGGGKMKDLARMMEEPFPLLGVELWIVELLALTLAVTPKAAGLTGLMLRTEGNPVPIINSGQHCGHQEGDIALLFSGERQRHLRLSGLVTNRWNPEGQVIVAKETFHALSRNHSCPRQMEASLLPDCA